MNSVFSTYKQRVRKSEKSIFRAQGEYKILKEELADVEKILVAVDIELDTLQKTMAFLQSVSVAARELARVQIEVIVTSALQYVFGNNYALKIVINTTKTGPEAEFLISTNRNGVITDTTPTLSNGGGIVDIVSLAIKFAVIELLNLDGFLVLDEPMKQVSREYIDAAGRLLEYIGQTSSRQIVYVTHNTTLANMATKVFAVSVVDGHSRIF